MSEPLLRIENLCRTVERDSTDLLLDDVSLSILADDRIGLLGDSGSGKTTLLRAMALLDPVQNGTIRLRGETVVDVPLYRSRVVYLHQRPAMIPGAVRDNLKLPFTWNMAEQSTYDESRIAVWLNLMDKPLSMLDQTVETLSGGEQQIVALLRAVQIAPQVLLLDEPTASLDSGSAERFEKLVNLWFDETDDAAFVWTSHDVQQVSRMTNRSWTIAAGKVTGDS